MTYQPVLVGQGAAGWALLKRTYQKQLNVFVKSPEIQRDEAAFRERIGKISSAEDLVADRQLLKVALYAFGLEADLPNKAFIQKVLESKTLAEGSFASKLADKQYLKLASTFGFGDFVPPRSKLSDFPDKILAQYSARRFEVAVGSQDDSMRLSLNLERELPLLLAKKDTSDKTLWLNILGNAPLRRVFETALGVSGSRGGTLDQQIDRLREKLSRLYGSDSPRVFSDPNTLQSLTRRYQVMNEITGQTSNSRVSSPALVLLSGMSYSQRY